MSQQFQATNLIFFLQHSLRDFKLTISLILSILEGKESLVDRYNFDQVPIQSLKCTKQADSYHWFLQRCQWIQCKSSATFELCSLAKSAWMFIYFGQLSNLTEAFHKKILLTVIWLKVWEFHWLLQAINLMWKLSLNLKLKKKLSLWCRQWERDSLNLLHESGFCASFLS